MDRNTKRIAMTVLGVAALGVAVAFFNVSEFGVDPFTMFVQGVYGKVSAVTSRFSYGTVYLMISAVELAAIFLIDKSKAGLGTVINLSILGYIVDYTSRAIHFLCGTEHPGLTLRIVFLMVGILLQALASAVYFTADMGVSTHDAVSLIASEKQNKIRFQYLRILSDLICVLTGLLLGKMFGIGTVISAFFLGPLVVFFRRNVAEPMLDGKKKK